MQIFIDLENSCDNFVVDPALTIQQLKNVIEDKTFIPSDTQSLYFNSKLLYTGTLEDNCLTDACTITMCFSLCGGSDSSRYKKSTSAMRWKWIKKRTRRLQRKRRKMRQRAR